MNLPETVIAKAQWLFQNEENANWAVGDFLHELWVEAGNYMTEEFFHGDGSECRQWICKELARECGKAIKTVRRRWEVSAFYPLEIREIYSPPLSYSHLRAAMGAGNDWQLLLDWGLEYMDTHNGKTPPVEMMQSKVNGEDDWERYWGYICRNAKKIAEDEEAPEWVQEICLSIVEMEIGDG